MCHIYAWKLAICIWTLCIVIDAVIPVMLCILFWIQLAFAAVCMSHIFCSFPKKIYIVHTVFHYRVKLLQLKYLLFRQARRNKKNTYYLYELNDLSNVIKFCETESYRSPDVQNTDASTGILFLKRMNE